MIPGRQRTHGGTFLGNDRYSASDLLSFSDDLMPKDVDSSFGWEKLGGGNSKKSSLTRAVSS
jgi:hypothetical protein